MRAATRSRPPHSPPPPPSIPFHSGTQKRLRALTCRHETTQTPPPRASRIAQAFRRANSRAQPIPYMSMAEREHLRVNGENGILLRAPPAVFTSLSKSTTALGVNIDVVLDAYLRYELRASRKRNPSPAPARAAPCTTSRDGSEARTSGKPPWSTKLRAGLGADAKGEERVLGAEEKWDARGRASIEPAGGMGMRGICVSVALWALCAVLPHISHDLRNAPGTYILLPRGRSPVSCHRAAPIPSSFLLLHLTPLRPPPPVFFTQQGHIAIDLHAPISPIALFPLQRRRRRRDKAKLEKARHLHTRMAHPLLSIAAPLSALALDDVLAQRGQRGGEPAPIHHPRALLFAAPCFWHLVYLGPWPLIIRYTSSWMQPDTGTSHRMCTRPPAPARITSQIGGAARRLQRYEFPTSGATSPRPPPPERTCFRADTRT
ncbi:hypothetical protein B0H13DRAFT_2378956 [Mycena leptocephala]|nr:hypothetical protein B0H13DRAFT_2378956 [Mycena leptocephala]